MKLSRRKNTFRNTIWGVVYRLVTLIGPFIIKTIIIKQLGSEYNGLNSLFTSILTVLNLANLGFSSSLVYMMYKAVVDDDMDSFCALVKYFRKIYKFVGLAILVMGMCIMPFLPKLVKGTYPPDVNLYILFAIYLLETALGYIMFSYTSAIFSAYQRNDSIHKIDTVRFLIQYTLQAIVLLAFSNYYLYIIIMPIMVIPNNIAMYITAKKQYPQITCRGELDKETKKAVYKRVITLFGHKVGSTVLVSIDSVIISAFLGLEVLSAYSNYYYILTAVNGIIEIVTNGSIAGIGNKLITDTKEENYNTFLMMNYAWVALVGGSAACMLSLYQPFIYFWIGKEYLLKNKLMILIVLYFFSWMFRIMLLTYRDAAGLWTKDWLKPYVGMILNLVGSIVLVYYTHNVAGVLIPTIIVFFLVYFPWETSVMFKYQFCRSSFEYYKKMIFYVFSAFFGCIITYVLSIKFFVDYSITNLALRLIVTVFVFAFIWIINTFRTKEFISFKQMIFVMIRKYKLS